ncbi:putative ureidoglycolate hydrolase [Aspergillus cavernicola]|uniref:Ureidoglycolate hydrolase n=1 Tax=Aspergillus cavernicola TaxID=176166 RepID=A0ABR4IVX8_9EURO
MSPPTLPTPPSSTLTPEPLTRASFASFGTAIIPPLPRTQTTPPTPLSSHPKHDLVPPPVAANQLSALKYSPISPLLNNYPGQCPSGVREEARMTMFSCFPRELRIVYGSESESGSGNGRGSGSERRVFDVGILERHPFTTQTFTPLDLSSSSEKEEETYYLVIVAPTLHNQTATATTETGSTTSIRDPPDLSRIRAFVAGGGQAVTYGAGTWHAPMVVIGKRRVDFVVVQFVNGVAEEDCQEVCFGEGVVVDLTGGSNGGVKAKL